MIGFLVGLAVGVAIAAVHYARSIHNQLVSIYEQGARMPTKQDFNTLLSEMNAATSRIAARIAALEDKIAGSGMSAEDESAVLAELATLRANLDAMGASPTEPVPPLPEPEPPIA